MTSDTSELAVLTWAAELQHAFRKARLPRPTVEPYHPKDYDYAVLIVKLGEDPVGEVWSFIGAVRPLSGFRARASTTFPIHNNGAKTYATMAEAAKHLATMVKHNHPRKETPNHDRT